MGGHDASLPPIPDWRIYRVENAPELMKVKRDLEARGLCYPWLRNEVWKFKKHPAEKSVLGALKFVFCGGFKYGLGAAVITIFAEKLYLGYVDSKYGGEHGDNHH